MVLPRAILLLAIIRLSYSAPHDPNISPEAAQNLVRERPWLANLEGCLVWNPECVRFGEDKEGYMLDEADDAATNETRCLHRASEYHAWCGNDFTNRTAAVFLQTGAMEVFPPFGCALYQRGCPAVSTRELEGVFFDDYDDAFMNETRCLQRALDFRVFCHPADSPEAVSAFYAPTAKHFVVSKLDASVHDDAHEALLPPPLTVAASADGDDYSGAGNLAEDKSGDDGEVATMVFNSTVRALWAVARAPPAFPSVAVPLALFDLAGDYLDCRSPPIPLSADAGATVASAQHYARVSRYHCNGPHAQLAVEALQLYLAVVPTHADAHYNLGVAFYALTELDNALGCFVAALRLEPNHSLALGALGTILTQQGRFQHAWDILDARVRPPLSAKDLRAAKERDASAATSSSSSSRSSSSSSEEAKLSSSSSSEEAPSSTGADSKTLETEEMAEKGAGLKPAVDTDGNDRSTAAAATDDAAAAAAATDEPKKKQPWWKFGGRFARKGKANEPIVLKSNAKAKDASAASSDGSKSSSSTETAAAKASATATATAAGATATPPYSSSSLSSSSSASLRLPEGISAPELVAWARLAPRFGCGSSAITLLRAYLDQQALEAAEVADFDLDAGVSEELQRHQGWHGVSASGGREAAAKTSSSVMEGAAVEGQASSPVVKASMGVRKQLEANMRFRLAALLDASSHDYMSSFREVLEANALVRSLNASSEATHLGISPQAALSQMAAMRSAYCRSCVHGQIPTAESWKGAIASARQSLQTSSSTSFVRSISNDHQDRSGEARQQQRKLVPVFVVGMPRSGSTLLEQMLAQHSAIAAGGEVPSLAVLSPRIFLDRNSNKKQDSQGSVDGASTGATNAPPVATFDPSVTSEDLDRLADRFMATLEHSAGLRNNHNTKEEEVRYVISKLPNHFELLGLIHKLFPGAPILHTTRDVRDTLLSNYQMAYQQGHRWSYNLTDAANFFAGYRAIMRHWQDEVFAEPLPEGATPLPMLEVRYEDFVCEPTEVARSVAKFLGLEYQPAMASPHESARTAHTSSNEQVRKPIYTASVGRWRLYAAPNDSASGSNRVGDGNRSGVAAAGGGGLSGDLEELAQQAGSYPAAALLERVLSFEPVASRAEARRDLARSLPCSSRDSSRGSGVGAEIRWPDSSGIARI